MWVNPLAPNVPRMDLDQQNPWEKQFWKKDALSKDAGHLIPSFLEVSFSHRCFGQILQVQIKHVVDKWNILLFTEFLWKSM